MRWEFSAGWCSLISRSPMPLTEAHLGDIFFHFLENNSCQVLIYRLSLSCPCADLAATKISAYLRRAKKPVRGVSSGGFFILWMPLFDPRLQTKRKGYARRRKSSTLITRHEKRESCHRVVTMSLSRGGRRLTPKGLVFGS